MAAEQMHVSQSNHRLSRWLFVASSCAIIFTMTASAQAAPQTNEERVAFWVEKLGDDNVATVRAFAAAMLGQIANAEADHSKLLDTLMTDRDIDVRTNAAAALGEIGGETLRLSVGALLTALKNDDGQLRSSAAMALARVDPSLPVDHLDDLIVALGDATVEVSIYCATALAKIGAPAIDKLVAALADVDQRAGAASALAQISADIPLGHLPALINGLADDDARVRSSCASVIGTMGDAVVEDLVKVLASGNQHARIAAVNVLRRIDANLLVPHMTVLIAALDDASIQVRTPCATILAEIGSTVEEQLINTLGAGTGRARAGAAMALAKLDPAVSDQYIADLVGGLGDDQSLVRRSCQIALANVGPLAALELMKALETDSGTKNRLEVLDSLIEVSPSPQALISVLLELLKDKDTNVRLRAVEVVRDAGSNSRRVTAAIVDRLKNDSDVAVQLAAINALVVIAPASESIPLLVATLAQAMTDDPDWVVRSLAARALGDVGPAAATASASLVKASKDPDVCVRTNAFRAIRMTKP